MKKVLGLSLAALLSYNIATADVVFAQGKYEPIKFGSSKESSKELTYELSQHSYNEHRHQRTIEERLGQSWGKIYIDKNGRFVAWGMIDGTSFVYNRWILNESLILIKDGVDIKLIHDYHTHSTGGDYAIVDGVEVPVGKFNFHERDSHKPWKELDLKGRLHYLFSTYTGWLNISAIRTKAEEVKRATNPEQLRESLDVFVK